MYRLERGMPLHQWHGDGTMVTIGNPNPDFDSDSDEGSNKPVPTGGLGATMKAALWIAESSKAGGPPSPLAVERLQYHCAMEEKAGIGDEGLRAISLALPLMPALSELNLTMQNLRDVGASALAAALDRLPLLTRLQMDSNKIGDDGISAIVKAIGAANTFRGGKSHHAGLPDAVEGESHFEWNCKHALSFGGNLHADGALKTLASELILHQSAFSGIETLSLGGLNVGDHGVIVFAASLEIPGALPYLKTLDLGCQFFLPGKLGEPGCMALAGALKEGALPRLGALKLDAKFSKQDQGAVALAAARAPTFVGKESNYSVFEMRFGALAIS